MPRETHHRVEVITGLAGRRYWPAHEKLRIIEESPVPWKRRRCARCATWVSRSVPEPAARG